jgi:serine/threonine protein kinase
VLAGIEGTHAGGPALTVWKRKAAGGMRECGVSHAYHDQPERIGPYSVQARLGSGPVGTVYRAIAGDGRRVAVKVFHAHLVADDAFRARLVREVAAACEVPRRRLVPVADAALSGPAPWIARPYVPGGPLDRELARREILSLPQLAWLAAGLAEGLARLHEAGVAHRDLKPSNILLSRYGPRITDFGTSAAIGRRAFAGTDLASAAARFMSPEQARGGDAGPAGDVFSAAAVLVHAARGTGPFWAGPPGTEWSRVAREEPDLEGVPAEIRPLLERCLARDPPRRPTARELRAALTYAELLPARPVPVTRPAPVMRPASAIRPGPGTEQADERLPSVPPRPPVPVRAAAPARRPHHWVITGVRAVPEVLGHLAAGVFAVIWLGVMVLAVASVVLSVVSIVLIVVIAIAG